MFDVILFREDFCHDNDTREELAIARSLFRVETSRTAITPDSMVIGRYSVLPYYQELERDLKLLDCTMINTYEQHCYVADIMQYYPDIADLTFPTYSQWGSLGEGEWVVKGKTNSRKFRWSTHMFARGRAQLMEVINRLMDDEMLTEQGLVVRQYIPLKRLGTGLNQLPISHEYRCFFYKENLLASGFYWASHPELDPGKMPGPMREFVCQAAQRVAKHVNFFVIDVAEKADGGYIVVELNDAQQSGLSMCDPSELYTNLQRSVF